MDDLILKGIIDNRYNENHIGNIILRHKLDIKNTDDSIKDIQYIVTLSNISSINNTLSDIREMRFIKSRASVEYVKVLLVDMIKEKERKMDKKDLQRVYNKGEVYDIDGVDAKYIGVIDTHPFKVKYFERNYHFSVGEPEGNDAFDILKVFIGKYQK